MNIGIGIIVFFVSLIALVAEFILYFMFGMGASFATKSLSSLEGIAFFFVGLMLLTGAIGILFPICCLIAAITKNKKLGIKIFLILIGLILIFYFIIVPITSQHLQNNKVAEPPTVITQTLTKTSTNQNPVSQKTSVEKEYIKNYLVFSNIRVDKGYGQMDIPGYTEPKDAVKGTLKNIGDKTINLVEITVYFLDANDKRVGEKSYDIVNTENIFNKTPPLKSNYTQDFGYIVAENAPSDWSRKIEVEVTKIEFNTDQQP